MLPHVDLPPEDAAPEGAPEDAAEGGEGEAKEESETPESPQAEWCVPRWRSFCSFLFSQNIFDIYIYIYNPRMTSLRVIQSDFSDFTECYVSK